MVHRLVPDEFRINDTNKVGKYRRPFQVVQQGEYCYALCDEGDRFDILQVRLHVPCDVSVVGHVSHALSMSLVGNLVIICREGNAPYVYPISDLRTRPTKMKKPELIAALTSVRKLPPGKVTVKDLRSCLEQHLKDLEQKFKDPLKLYGVENLDLVCSTGVSDDMLIGVGANKSVYQVHLKHNGVSVVGTPTFLFSLPDTLEVRSLTCYDTTLYLTGSEGLYSCLIHSGDATLLVPGNIHGVTSTPKGVAFTDIGSCQVKMWDRGSGQVSVLAGNGERACRAGSALRAAFMQPTSIWAENGLSCGTQLEAGTTFYIADPASASILQLTPTSGMCVFLENLRKLTKAFDVHLKNEVYTKQSLNDSIGLVGELHQYLLQNEARVRDATGLKTELNGPKGTVSTQSRKSVGIILSELVYMKGILKDKAHMLNMAACTTTDVENLHALSHYKRSDTPTMLQYAWEVAVTVREKLKQTTHWGGYYFTSHKSYYPLPDDHLSLSSLPAMLPPPRHYPKLTKQMENTMKDWCHRHGRCVRQLSVRQQNTKFKAGTLPLNMYRRPLPDQGDYSGLLNSQPGPRLDTGVVGVSAEETEDEAHEDDVESRPEDIEITYDSSEDQDSYASSTESDSEIENVYLPVIKTGSGRTVKPKRILDL